MSNNSFSSFGNVVSDVLSLSKTDPVLHILVLTYEFDEQQLVNLVCSQNLEEDFELRQSQLKILSNLRPVVIYDARKTKSFSKLPQFLELHPFKTPGFSCHHSKAYLIVTEKTVRLVLGSFNLTATGLFRNREVFEYFHWDTQQTDHLEVLKEWTTFLQLHYANRLRVSSLSALSTIIEALNKRYKVWSNDHAYDAIHLLHSGYDSSTNGLKELRKHWDLWFPSTHPDSLVAVSPFFDESPQIRSLAADLQEQFPEIQAITLITDQSASDFLCQAHFGSIAKKELLLIPAELSASERQRIERLASQTGSSIKDQRITRKLHAKVLMLHSGNNALLYLGSANFSRKAWKGNNQELGIVWKEGNPEKVRASIITNLSVAAEDRYGMLPSLPPAKLDMEDDEGYNEDTNFPGFIEMIQLTPNQDLSRVRFKFELGNRSINDKSLSLNDYVVHWSGIELQITDFHSQWIDRQDFQNRLVGARNLSFQLATAIEQVFWFPFQYEGNLIAERETFMHPSTWDWMAFYLNPDPRSPRKPCELIPGEQNGSEDPDRSELDSVSREENCVIAMQGYLTLFSRVEKDFYKRVQELESMGPECRARSLKQQVLEPLSGFSRLLEREASDTVKKGGAKEVAPADVFKMGELLLLTQSLAARTPGNLRVTFKPLQLQIRSILKGWKGRNQLRSAYLAFVSKAEAA